MFIENYPCLQARSLDYVWGGAGPPKVDLLDQKHGGLLEPHPLIPPYKNSIFDPLCDKKWTFW